MSLLLLCFAIFAPFARADDPSWQRAWRGLPELVAILQSVPEGKAVLARAGKKNAAFLAQIKVGEASFTESTFSRTYSLLDGKEQISLRHEVSLNRRLSLADGVVDLAHELVHYAEKGMLDPYRPGFALDHFVRNGIEGDGGELKALAVECKVAWELERAYSSFPPHRLCERYRLPKQSFHFAKARQDYYALGAWWPRAQPKLKEQISELSPAPVVFTSSYAGKPYPIALAEEYAMTRKAACANNRRKYRLIASQAEGGRSLASDALGRERLRLKAYERLYCRGDEE